MHTEVYSGWKHCTIRERDCYGKTNS